jgi:HEAT repeat protein
VLDVILLSLSKPDLVTRRAAAEVMGALGPAVVKNAKSLQALLRTLESSEIPAVASDRLFYDPIVDSAADEPDMGRTLWTQMRAAAASAIGAIGPAATNDVNTVPMLHACLHDAHRKVRRSAIEALGKIVTTSGGAQIFVKELLAQFLNPDMQETAAESVQRLQRADLRIFLTPDGQAGVREVAELSSYSV